MPKWRYIIRGDASKAVPVHSDLDFNGMCDHVREHSKKIHPDSIVCVFRIGAIEIVNPMVMMVDDFANFGPYLIGVE